ncbi:MAG: hypothetical protein WC450_12375 [Candidatus Omnitrophota bacterium]
MGRRPHKTRLFSFSMSVVVAALAMTVFPVSCAGAEDQPDINEILYNLRLKQEDIRDIYLQKRQELTADFQEKLKELRAESPDSKVIRAAIEDYKYQQRSLKAAYRKVMRETQEKIDAIKLKGGGYSSSVSVIQLLQPKVDTYCPPTLYERVLLNIRC